MYIPQLPEITAISQPTKPQQEVRSGDLEATKHCPLQRTEGPQHQYSISESFGTLVNWLLPKLEVPQLDSCLRCLMICREFSGSCVK